MIVLCVVVFNKAFAQTDTPETDIDTSETQAIDTAFSEIAAHTRADSIINYAYTFLGNKYRRGGTSSKGFDCSGYTLTVYNKFGVKLPHTSAGQGLMGYAVNKSNVSKGDLIFFRGRNRRSNRIGHVGIVISEKGQPVRFIHSSVSSGVRIDRLDYDYYRKRYVKAVRILSK